MTTQATPSNLRIVSDRVCLYCEPTTSAVSEEYETLHAAIADAVVAPEGSLLISNGTILASMVSKGWLLDNRGIERLTHEFLTKIH